jgi:hypothetical protein
MRVVRTLLAAALLILAAACSHPCADLADETCALRGAGSSACASARELAEQAGGRDHRACSLALEVLKGGRSATP